MLKYKLVYCMYWFILSNSVCVNYVYFINVIDCFQLLIAFKIY